MKQGVVLVHHGTVEDLDDMPAFLKNVRRGRDASPELQREMRRRYEEIGGSPLGKITARVAKKLESVIGTPVRAAGRLWPPSVKDVASELGVERLVVIPLAQHSAHVYAEAARREAGVRVVAAGNWGQTPALLAAFAARIRAAARPNATLVLTAHSLPKHVIAAGDAYEREVRVSAEAIASRVADLFPETRVAFQSQGADGGDWLGPTLVETLDAIKTPRVVIAPIGFLADHVEILYDIDIEAAALATARGIELTRTESLNDADDFVAVLADIAKGLLA